MLKVLVALFLLPIMVFGQETGFKPVSNSMPVIEQLNNRANEIASFQCNFRQQKYMSYLDATVESKGRFVLKKNNRIRWEYTEPNQYLIIINEGKVSIKTPNQNNSAIPKENKLLDQLNTLVKSTLNGKLGQDEHFVLSLYENAEVYRIVLVPKTTEMKSFLKVIKIDFTKKTLDINILQLIEVSDDYTSLNFENQIFNKSVPDSEFEIR
jgi:outer membrane lipoprotein carrier protein